MRRWQSARSLRRRQIGPALKAILSVELLEQRNLLTPTNVLVNNVTEDASAQDTQSETSIVLGSGSDVVVAFNDSEEFVSGGNHFTGFAQSTNGGSSFTDEGGLPRSRGGDAGDPALARDATSGNIYLTTLAFSTSNAIQFFKSTNDGVSFGRPVNSAPGFGASDLLDKPWLTVDNFAGAGQGNIYQTFTDFGLSTSILFTKSADGGKKWGPSGGTALASGIVQGSTVVVGPDHAVYVFWLAGGNGTPASIVVRKSTDQGNTFAAGVTAANLSTTGVNGDLGLTDSSGRVFRSNAFPQAAVNPVNGNIYVVYDDKGVAAGDKADVFFTQSTNGGATWSTPVKVNDDTTTNDQWQPAIAVTPDGTHLGIFWYDRRLDTADNLIDRFGVIGAISGSSVTFGANGRITDVSFPPAFGQDPVIVGSYMGDYDQAAADNSLFYTTWGDNRLSDAAHAHNPDVRFAKVPVTGIVGPKGTFIPRPSSASPNVVLAPLSLLSRAQTIVMSDDVAAAVQIVVQALSSTQVTAAKSNLAADSPSTRDPGPLATARVDQFFIKPRPEDQTLTIPVHEPPNPEIGDWLIATHDRLWTPVD